MAATVSVSNTVLSIIASFSSGLDVFKELRDKRRRRKKQASGGSGGGGGGERLQAEVESRLAKSLRRGPEDIGREYQGGVQAVGNGFAVGDAQAQTSLAEILLKLNTGLVGIITSFLNRGKRDVDLDYQALTALSDRSRIDTCRTLRHLFRRMQSRPQQLTLPSPQPAPREQRKRTVTTKQTKIRGPTLARVIIQNSSKPSQIAMVKPGERRRKSASSSNVSSARNSPPPQTPPPPYTTVENSEVSSARPSHQRRNTASDPVRVAAQQSALELNTPPLSAPVPVDGRHRGRLRAAQSTPRLHLGPRIEEDFLPHLPSRRHLPVTPDVAKQKARDGDQPLNSQRTRKSVYSFASTSTKLGEIPLHKWAEPFDFDAMSVANREAARHGWPAYDIDGSALQRRQGFLGRLFRRKESI